MPKLYKLVVEKRQMSCRVATEVKRLTGLPLNASDNVDSIKNLLEQDMYDAVADKCCVRKG